MNDEFKFNIYGTIGGQDVDYYVYLDGSDNLIIKDGNDNDITSTVIVDISVEFTNNEKTSGTVTFNTKSGITFQTSDSFNFYDSDDNKTTNYKAELYSSTPATYTVDTTGTLSGTAPAQLINNGSSWTYAASSNVSITINGLTQSLWSSISDHVTIDTANQKIILDKTAVDAIGQKELTIDSNSEYTFDVPNAYSTDTWVEETSGSGIYLLYAAGSANGAVLSENNKKISKATPLAKITGLDCLSDLTVEDDGTTISRTVDGEKKTIIAVNSGYVTVKTDIANLLAKNQTATITVSDEDSSDGKTYTLNLDGSVNTTVSVGTKTLETSTSDSSYLYKIAAKTAYNVKNGNTLTSYGATDGQTFTVTGLPTGLTPDTSTGQLKDTNNNNTVVATFNLDGTTFNVTLEDAALNNQTITISGLPDSYSVNWNIPQDKKADGKAASISDISDGTGNGFTYTSAGLDPGYDPQGNTLTYSSTQVTAKTFTITGLVSGNYTLGDNGAILKDNKQVGTITLVGELFTVTFTDSTIPTGPVNITSESNVDFALVVNGESSKDPVETSLSFTPGETAGTGTYTYIGGYNPKGYVKTSNAVSGNEKTNVTFTKYTEDTSHIAFKVEGLSSGYLSVDDIATINGTEVTLKASALPTSFSSSDSTAPTITLTKNTGSSDVTFKLGTAANVAREAYTLKDGASVSGTTITMPTYKEYFTTTEGTGSLTITGHKEVGGDKFTISAAGTNVTLGTLTASTSGATTTLFENGKEIGKVTVVDDNNDGAIDKYTFTFNKTILDKLKVKDGSLTVANVEGGTALFDVALDEGIDNESTAGKEDASFGQVGGKWTYTAAITKKEHYKIEDKTISYVAQDGGAQFQLSGLNATNFPTTATFTVSEGVIQISDKTPPVSSQK